MNHYSVFGLFLDLVGVILLGVDLVRFQLAVRERAKKSRAFFAEMEAEYGGIESWANDIMERSEWIPSSAYSRHHSEDEASYNARHAMDGLKDISSAVNGLAQQVVKVTKKLNNYAEQDGGLASSSVRFSMLGLFFLVFGFFLQIFGAWSA
ncbi:MAG: hypothetical protein OXH76_01230 [Boseongicola sp.]|nr:hypothetical protein [Boseongicola sp.]